MYFARHSPAVAHVNNKLFVFGGGSPSPLLSPGPERTIECFDFERHEWFVLQAKIPGRSNAVYVSAFFDNLDTWTIHSESIFLRFTKLVDYNK